VKAEIRQTVADALRAIPELNGNMHAYPPDALAPPVAYVETCELDAGENGTLQRLPVTVQVVFVADGQSMAARQRLDAATDQAWRALKRAGFRPQADRNETVTNGPNVVYPAERLTALGLTECP
jgi:hypothetical protein